MPHRLQSSSGQNGHDHALTTVTHAALRADEQHWRTLTYIGLRLSDSQLFEVRRCPDCAAELLKPICAAMALRMLMGRLANQNVPNPLLQSIQVLSQWADRLTPTKLSTDDLDLHDADMIRIQVGTPLVEAEYQIVQAALKVCAGSRTETAKLLGLSRRTLYNKLQSLRRKRHWTDPPPVPGRRRQPRLFEDESAPSGVTAPTEERPSAERAQPQQ